MDEQIRHREPPRPRSLSDVPADLEAICLKALRKAPAAGSAKAVLRVIDPVALTVGGTTVMGRGGQLEKPLLW